MPIPPELAALPSTCVHGATLPHGNFRLENNDWAAGGIAHTQCIYAAASPGPDPQFGWSWDYPTGHGGVMAYPEVVFGKKPWASTSTVAGLPRIVSPLPILHVAFDLRTVATGKHNTAFEVWLTRTAAASHTEITNEVMWWLDSRGGADPAGSPVASGLVFSDGRVCDLWIAWKGDEGWDQPWNYFAFVYRTAVTTGNLDCAEYLQYLVHQGYVPRTDHIASLEFGNEIWRGEGHTIVDRYDVMFA